MKENGKMDLRKALESRKSLMDQNIQVIGYKENEMGEERSKFHRSAIMMVASQWE